MRNKVILPITLTLIFLLTNISQVLAVYPTGYTLNITGTGTSELSTEQYHSPNQAVKMATVTTSDRGEIMFSGGPTLSSLTDLSYWTYTVQGGDFDQLTAWVGIYLHAQPNKDIDDWFTDYYASSPDVYYIQAEPIYPYSDYHSVPDISDTFDQWVKWDAFDTTIPLTWIGLETSGSPHGAPTLTDYAGGAVPTYSSREYGSLYISAIKIRVGYGGPWANTLVYVDDVTINDYNENFGIDTMALLEDLKFEINALSDDDGVDLKKPAMNRKANLVETVNNVIDKVNAGNYRAAIMKLENDLKPKLDHTSTQTWATNDLGLLWKIDALVNALSE